VSLIPRAATQVPGFDLHSPAAVNFSSAATPQVDGKDSGTAASPTATPTEEVVEPVQPGAAAEGKGGTEQVDSEDVNKEDLVGGLGQKLALLEQKDKEIKDLKDKLLWSLAEMENVRQRTKRDADSTRKYAIQVRQCPI
jgi:molecular chaperone GrpE (heat shock protein)